MNHFYGISRIMLLLKKWRVNAADFIYRFLSQFRCSDTMDFKKSGIKPYFRVSRSTHPKDVLGRAGEEAAEKYLKAKRYKILFRNIVFPSCEIDIIALDLNTGETVFIEVKTKRSSKYYRPIDNIDTRRVPKILRASQEYLLWKKSGNERLRYDFISIVWPLGQEPVIEHYIAAAGPEI